MHVDKITTTRVHFILQTAVHASDIIIINILMMCRTFHFEYKRNNRRQILFKTRI